MGLLLREGVKVLWRVLDSREDVRRRENGISIARSGS